MHFQKTLVINFYGLNSNRDLFLFLKMRDSQADLGFDQVHPRISSWNFRWPVRVNRGLNQAKSSGHLRQVEISPVLATCLN